MYEIKVLDNDKKAQALIDFCFSDNIFVNEWAPGEKEMVRSTIADAVIHNENCHYWYMENGDKIIGFIGIRENHYKSGGWSMDNEYFAVHPDYRRRGLGTKLLVNLEKFVVDKKGRYITLFTTDTDYYLPARFFYEKHGYQKVGCIPDYFVIGEGKLEYYKKLDK